MDGNKRNSHNLDPLSDHRAAPALSVEQLKRLVRLLDRSDVSELELKNAANGTHLLLRKARASEHSDQQGISSLPPVVSASATPPAEPETTHKVAAPLVGIFHGAARSRGKPLVAVGDIVKAGQHVAAIESLNVLNEVEAPVTGRIVEILVEEGQPVEYGQALMMIDSAEEA